MADPGPITNSYAVHASVPGPAPTIAPTIDSPVDGSKFTGQPITVRGTCPLDTYVTLYRNGAFSGVALCQADGTWQLETGLFPGVNQLQARAFSQTDQPGPVSGIVTVTYEPKQSGGNTPGMAPGKPAVPGQAGNGSTGSGTAELAEPLIFKTNYTYQGHYVGQASAWQLAIEGGMAPYAIAVDWGDGTRGLLSRPGAGSFAMEHIYKKPGAYKGSYVLKFSATDNNGEEAFLQLMTIVNNPPAGVAIAKHAGGENATPSYLTPLLRYVWPGYGVCVLMLFSFWLGERHEFGQLKPRLKKVRHA